MKKIVFYVVCFSFLFLTGCELGNTPTSKVEAYLSDYQMLDKDVSLNYQLLSEQNNLNDELKMKYQNLVETQYRNLSYEVKEEEINGNDATVVVQIEVLDYYSVIEKYNVDDYDNIDYHNRVIEDLEDAKEKITYTIDFKVSKDQDGTWIVNPLKQEDLKKMLGMYSG